MLAFDFDKLLITTIIGLSTGAIYAVIAGGLVVTYTTSGIFNLAHGATGVLAAFTYWQLRFDWGWPAPIALLIVLFVLCPLFGAFTERYIMRGLKDTTEVVRLSVTVALFSAMIGLTNWLWPTGESRAGMRRFFEGNQVSIGGINVSWHKLITMGCAIVVALVLRLLMYRSRTGLAMRAVVDDRDLTELNGARPDWVAMLSWALGATLAGLAGILLAGEQGINVEPLILLVINAYAAAIIGRLRSLPMTFAGAVLLGLLDAFYLGYSDADWFPKSAFGFSLTGVRASIPTIVLFAALILMPQARLRAGVVRLREKHIEPSWSTAFVGAGVLIAFTVAISGMLTRADTLLLINAFLLAIAALSLVPLTGYAGMVSLAPLTFAGLGAVAMAKLPGNGNLLSLLGAMAIVAAVGAVVAVPALRVTGVYLALATAAFAVLVTNLVFNQRQTFQTGNIAVPPLDLPGLDLSSPRARLVMLSCAFSVLGLGVVAVRRSALGRRFIAVKDSQAAAATIGMNVTAAKVAAFAISAAIAACSGALTGDRTSAQRYDFLQSLPVVLLAVVGGVAAVSGALLGGMMLGANAVIEAIAGSEFVRNLAKVLPGTLGMTLGRSPAGVTDQTSEGYRPLVGRWGLIALAAAGAVAIWALTTTGAVSHWSFVFAMTVWMLGIVPLLTQIVDHRDRRSVLAAVFLLAAVCVAAFVDWGTTIATAGWRVVALVLLMVVVIQVTRRILDREPKAPVASPDDLGLDRELTAAEVEEIDRALQVVL